ncbi:PREDICTED: uncharacterized protein LOC108565596 [Nicrophorus vespilloides]|uniref:Uncharacterized protein LOC108565596 n=1 Tax=Nicrophorus vespilloides TaxID=110193 RepID=A0ABM1N1C6_NICVS|nr:PREDICTED: uncharacterized protein LOC108565596 [Nicrophorus vespilloides]
MTSTGQPWAALDSWHMPIGTGQNINVVANQLNQSLSNIDEFLTEKRLAIVPSKTMAMGFTRKTVRTFPLLRVRNIGVEYVRAYKFLGIWFDDKLCWRNHIGSLVRSCYQGVNILRALSGLDWGSDPRTLLMFFRGYVRSRLDYACGLYSFCAKALLDQLDRIQNQCLRICIGVLSSTPLIVLHVETGVFPLEIRRAELARRYCVKCRASPPSAARPLVDRAASEFQQNPFWPAKGIPLLIQAWRDTETFRTIVDKRAIKKYLRPTIGRRYAPHKITEISSHLDLSPSVFTFRRLPGLASIYTAELYPIHRALRLTQFHEKRRVAIITDSMSAIDAITSQSTTVKANHWVVAIRTQIRDMETDGGAVVLCWVPNHQGILGNEEADVLAGRGHRREIIFC